MRENRMTFTPHLHRKFIWACYDKIVAGEEETAAERNGL